MRQKNQKVNQVFGLGYGQTAEAPLKPGSGIARIIIDTSYDDGGTARASLDPDQLSITLELNGDPIVPALTGAELRMMRGFDREYSQAGMYVLDYFDFNAKSIMGEQEPGLPTNPEDNIILKVSAGARRLAADSGSGVDQPVNPALKISVRSVDMIDPKTGGPLRRTPNYPIKVFRRKSLTTNAAGEIQWMVENGYDIRRAFFKSDDITHLSVKINGRDQLDKISKSDLEFDQKCFKRTPQAGYLIFDPGMTGRKQVDRLGTSGLDVELNPWVSQGGTIQVLMDNFETGRGLL